MTDAIISQNKGLYTFGPFRLDAGERRLLRENREILLATKAFDLLVTLVAGAGRLQSREALTAALWPDTIVEEHSLTWNVSALRKALGDEGSAPQYIETVRGHGYRFIAPVTIETLEISKAHAAAVSARQKPWPWIATAFICAGIAGLLIWYFTSGPTAKLRTTSQSIAVLPFENLGADKSNAYFVRGIHDLILTKLAGIATLKVIARASTEDYPSHPRDPSQVARQLGVATLLEGSIQQQGERVLINVQLVDAHSGNHLWAQAYIRKLDNVIDVESDVAQKVATALKLRLLPKETHRLASIPTQNPKAYDLFLKAGYFATQVTGRSNAKSPSVIIAKAVQLYRQAIARDPHFALAWARLSYLESYAYWFRFNSASQTVATAEKAAQHALALEPDLPQAHVAMGFVYYYYHRDYTAALTQFQQAKRGLPNSADTIAAIAYIHRRQGKWKEALAGLRQAAVLDPHNPRWSYNTGVTLMALRRYSQAVRQFDRALAIEPDYYSAMVRKVWVLILAGKLEQARLDLKKIPRAVNPRGLVTALRFSAAWLAHQWNLALAILNSTSSAWVRGPGTVAAKVPKSLLLASVRAQTGNHLRARHAYEKALKQLQDALHVQPDSPDLWSALGLVKAILGEKEAAIHAGRHATTLLPIREDALDGPAYMGALAQIYAHAGEPDRAIKLLGRLLAMPAGLFISVPLLKLDPTWDPIRSDPAFQELLKRYGKKTRTPTS